MLVKTNWSRSRTQEPVWAQLRFWNIRSEQKYRDSSSVLKMSPHLFSIPFIYPIFSLPITVLEVLPDKIAVTQNPEMLQVITFQAHSILDSFEKCLCVFWELRVLLKDFLNFRLDKRTEKIKSYSCLGEKWKSIWIVICFTLSWDIQGHPKSHIFPPKEYFLVSCSSRRRRGILREQKWPWLSVHNQDHPILRCRLCSLWRPDFRGWRSSWGRCQCLKHPRYLPPRAAAA